MAQTDQFLLRFQKPEQKKLLMVNPGFQIHLTDFDRDVEPGPSNFVAKLRKHVKSRRVNRIELAKKDRVIIFSFSDDHDYHLVLEFFAGGNVILLDNKFKIISLLKTVATKKTENIDFTDKYGVGSFYDVNSLIGLGEESEKVTRPGAVEIKEWLKNTGAVNTKKKKALQLRNFLYVRLPQLSSNLMEQSLSKMNIDPTKSVTDIDANDADMIDNIVAAINDAFDFADQLLSSSEIPGYIVTEKNTQFTGEPSNNDSQFIDPLPIVQVGTLQDPRTIEYLYTDYLPYKPQSNAKLVKTNSFNATVDYFYSTIEANKTSMKALNKEQALEKRFKAAQLENQKRLDGLTETQIKNEKLGLALQLNSDLAEEAAGAVKDLIEQKLDWKDIERIISTEKTKQNPIAKLIILPLNLSSNKITLSLPDPEYIEELDDESDADSESSESESDSEEEGNIKKKQSKKSQKSLIVEYDLSLSAWANSRKYFEVKRVAAAKHERTLKSSAMALKSAEKKIQRDINRTEKHTAFSGLRTIRDPFLFEKFYWFISSEGYLVLGGRDLIQNQLLFRRYFQAGDILVTADADGASIVIVKGKPGHLGEEFPPSTLIQAGAFAAASSTKAWESKQLPRSWYGRFEDIDKVTKDNKLVRIDNIEVRGGRNIILYQSLDMGLGFMWLLEDGSIQEMELENEDADALESVENEVKKQENDNTESEDEVEDDGLDSDSDDDMFGDTKLPTGVLTGQVDVSSYVSSAKNGKSSETEEEQAEVEEDDKKDTSEDEFDAEKGKTDDRNEISDDNDVDEDDEKSSSESSIKEDTADKPKSSNDEDEPSETVIDIEKRLQMLSAGNSRKIKHDQQPPKVKKKRTQRKSKQQQGFPDSDDEKEKAVPVPSKKNSKAPKKSKKEIEAEAEARRRKNEQLRKEREKKAAEQELENLLSNELPDDIDGLKIPIALVPKLAPGQKPIAAIPVFGPWDAMKRMKFKIKITKGTTKKGKAVSTILNKLNSLTKLDETQQDPDYPWPIEIALIKMLKSTEVTMAIAVSKVDIHFPNSSGTEKKGSGSGGKRGGRGGKGGKRR